MEEAHTAGRERAARLAHHSLVVVLEVDPAAQALDGALPLLRVPRHDAPAVLVVCLDAHLEHLGIPRMNRAGGHGKTPRYTGQRITRGDRPQGDKQPTGLALPGRRLLWLARKS